MAAPSPSPDTQGFPRLRRFEILRELGRGNTGTIYHVRARVALGGLRPGDEAALKMLHPHLMAQEDARKAFLREARAGMQVRHPNLVRVHAVEEVIRGKERRRYLVLEKVQGWTLREWLEEDGLAVEPTLRLLGRQIAGALAALHRAGLLHLDVKPENIVWNEDRAVLMDLGFTRRNPEAAVPPRGGRMHESGGSDALFVGTPAYAAPELLAGKKPSAAVDLFALGVTLYECATGVRPFGDERDYGLFEARRTAFVRKPSTIQPRLSPFFDAVVLRLLAEKPEKRFPSAEALEQVFAEGERSQWWREQGDAAPLLPILHPDALPFAGRDRELARIEAAFQEARDTRTPRILILHGRPAVGKSRLAMEVASRWRQRPEAPPFLYGRCIRLGRGSAFRAVRGALARSLGLTPDQPPTPSVEKRLRAALSPGSAEVLIGLLQGRIYSREIRARAFREWFLALGREGPLLAFFDDVQVTGRNLWRFMDELSRLEGLPALILLAHRDDLTPQAAEARTALLRRPNVHSLHVRPLSEKSMETLLRAAFEPGGLPGALEEDLIQVARGHPGTLNDLLRLLKQRGEVAGPPGGLRVSGGEVTIPLTADQAEILRTELAEMSEPNRDLLLWSAMLTPPLDVALLAELSGYSEVRVARGLNRLRLAGWLKVENGLFRFALPRLREAAYRYVAPKGQRRRHAQVFEVLSRTERPVSNREAALAFHAHRAGLHAEALQLGLPKVELQVAGGAFEQARQALKILTNHAESVGRENLAPSVRVRLLIAQAHVAGAGGDRELEAADLKEAGRMALEAGDDRLAARVHLGLARHARAMGFASVARFHVQRARDLAGGRTPPATQPA